VSALSGEAEFVGELIAELDESRVEVVEAAGCLLSHCVDRLKDDALLGSVEHDGARGTDGLEGAEDGPELSEQGVTRLPGDRDGSVPGTDTHAIQPLRHRAEATA
jgi:hypothetical protein